MAIAVGVSKQLVFKKETTWGTQAAPTGPNGQALRRVTSDLGLKKATYRSNEIRPDLQISDFRHGARQVAGTIKGEMSPGTYSLFMASLCRKDFAVVSPMATLGNITVGAAVAGVYPITRTVGSWVTDGMRIGMVFRITGAGLVAATTAKNLFVVSMTATILQVVVLNGTAIGPDTAVATCTATVVGKVTYAPTTGFTNDSYTIEHWFSDITVSHQYIRCRADNASFSLPPTGMATNDFAFQGKDRVRGVAQYFTSPLAATTAGVLASVNGVLMAAGAPVAIITGMQFTLDTNRTVGQVVGANVTPDVFGGSIEAKGTFSAYLQDDSFQALLDNETEFTMAIALTTDNTATADFISYTFPRCKVGSADIGDGQIGLTQSLSFQALFNGAQTVVGTEKTTIQINDSLA